MRSHMRGRGMIECGVDLDRTEVPRIKLQPIARGEVLGIKDAAPVIETPRARPDRKLAGSVDAQSCSSFSDVAPATWSTLLAITPPLRESRLRECGDGESSLIIMRSIVE